MKPVLKSDEFTRRRFAEDLAKSLLGVSILGTGVIPAQVGGKPNADSCILLLMKGGMSHLDTFDPKPENSEVMGRTKVIPSAITGVPFGESVPQMAKLANKLTVIRSMYQKTADHRQATYIARTGYSMRPSVIHPSLGPWAQKLHGKRGGNLPDSVVIGGGSDHPGRGFLGPEYSPLPIGNPSKGVPNMIPADVGGASSDEIEYSKVMKRRLELSNALDQTFRKEVPHEKVTAYTQFYEEAVRFLQSDDLKLFDLSTETPKVRARYGNSQFGQGCLLAKKLIKGGVRFVEVTHQNFDTHVDHFSKFPSLAGTMDQVIANLIQDLEAEGLLQRTLIVITTEFGRTPKINANSGRDHHAQAYSTVLAGGGVSGGTIVGKSDASGNRLESEKHQPRDLNATIAYALGLDRNKIVNSPSGRPFKIATENGNPILEVFL